MGKFFGAVAQINRVGGVNREIRVNLEPNQLQSLGITATQVNNQIRALNINLPGGRLEVGGREQTIRTLGSAKSINVLKNYEITLPQGIPKPVKISTPSKICKSPVTTVV